MLTKENRVVDVFIVSDAETKTAIPEDRWADIKEKIFAKLKRRNVLNTATGDPKLAEQVSSSHDSFLITQFWLVRFNSYLVYILTF